MNPSQYSAVVSSKTVAPGINCKFGGIQVDSGIDDNGNSILDPAEVDNTEYVCNGADGLVSVFAVGNEPAGNNCPGGGKTIRSGLDNNRNGALDTGETTSTTFICSGTDINTGTGTGTTLKGQVSLAGVYDPSTASVSLSGTTYVTAPDQNGFFTFNSISQGEYSIEFSAPGYATVTLPYYRIFAGIPETTPHVVMNRGIFLTEPDQGACAPAFSPDSSYVIYIDKTGALYSQAVSGGVTVKLASPDTSFCPLISPDSSFVVYLDMAENLYSVPMSGGSPSKLGSGIISNLNFVEGNVMISPDSRSVVYTDSFETLYSAAITGGGTPTRLANNIPLRDYSHTHPFQISPDSSYVVYEDSPGGFFSIPVSGGTPVKLGSNIITSEDSYKITPDSSFIAYRDNARNLFLIGKSGGTPEKINNEPVYSNSSYRFTSDSSYFVYMDRPPVYQPYPSLFAMSVSGGTAVEISSEAISFEVSPNGLFAAYRDSSDTLYSVRISGGVPIILGTDSPAPGSGVFQRTFTPDSSSVVYQDIAKDLYSVPVAGGAPVRLESGLLGTAPALRYRLTPDSSSVIYEKITAGRTNASGLASGRAVCGLFSVPVSGGVPVKIGAGLDCSLENWGGTSPNSSYVFYHDKKHNSYTVPLTGGVEKAFGGGTEGANIGPVLISPDSKWLLYTATYSRNSKYYSSFFKNAILYQAP